MDCVAMPAGAVGDKLRLAFGSGFRGRRCVLRSRRPVLRSIESGRARVGTRAGGVINAADVLMGEQVTPARLGVAERRCGAEKFDQCGQEMRAGCLVEIVACGGNLDGHGVGHCVGEGLLMPRRDRLIVRAPRKEYGDVAEQVRLSRCANSLSAPIEDGMRGPHERCPSPQSA
jgi:hypothetical protein